MDLPTKRSYKALKYETQQGNNTYRFINFRKERNGQVSTLKTTESRMKLSST